MVEDGVYWIKNASSGTVMDLDNGNWQYGQVQCWEHNNQDGTNGFRNQRWMVVKAPDDNSYHIINVFYGVFAGVFKDERNAHQGSRWVKAAPISAGAWAPKWDLELRSDGHYNFKWKMDNGQFMDLNNGRAHGNCQLWDHSDNTNMQWELIREPTIDDSGKMSASWMSHVPGDTKLNMMNIPATHQSLALHGVKSQGHEGPEQIAHGILVDNPRCQNRSPYEQMNDGIRIFDCRFDRWTSDAEASVLYAHHGNDKFGAHEGYSLGAVLQSCRLFLSRFPRETLIVNITNETGTAGFRESFLNDYHCFSGNLFCNAKGKHLRDIRLDDVRGKIVITQSGTDIGDDFTSNFFGEEKDGSKSEGTYDRPPPEWPIKIRDCQNLFNGAKNDHDSNHSYSTSWNMSSISPNIFDPAAFALYNPIDFFLFARPFIQQLYSQDNCGRDGQFRFGLVYFDFYEQVHGEILNIIRSNKGCGHL